MKILLIEPFFTGSHKAWAEDYARFSEHDVTLLTLSGHYWKWRMHGGAVTLARKFMEGNYKPDILLVSDMLDLTTFLSLTRSKTANIPVALYMHENQLTYPWSPTDQDVKQQRDNHYSFINYTSALAANKVFFNSKYHLNSFLEELPVFLKSFPDHNELETVDIIKAKSEHLPLGLDLKRLDKLKPETIEYFPRALILWNHRWEYDKNPEGFFESLFELKERGVEFKLAVLGESFKESPAIFETAKEKLKDEIVHFGYAKSEADYAEWLWRADILPVTSKQDFFGGSVIEAMYCNTIPLLPKRLAYPEHLPEQYHGTFFYDDQRGFVNKLQRLIFDVRVIRNQNTAHFILCYDWEEMAKVYDKRLVALL